MFRYALIDAEGVVINVTYGDTSWPFVAYPQEWVQCPEGTRIGDAYDRNTQTFTEQA